jgi:hypothetical protein
MSADPTHRRRLTSLIGVLAGVLAVALLALTLGAGGARGPQGPGSLFGWAVPLVSLFVIVAVTWLLLARDGNEPDVDDDLYVPCEACGHAILPEWRLCPYCGSQLRAWNPGGGSLNRG